MNEQDYGIFRQRIHNSAREKKFPLRVMWELTYRCNFKCKHCYIPEKYKTKKGELKTREIFSIIDQLREIGCFYLGFTGGEPFLRRDIMQILRYARRSGFEVIIYTNGSLIDEEAVSQLRCLRPNKIDITIPAMSRDAFDGISGVQGSRDRVFTAIELLHHRRVNLGFKSCVLKENESEINKIRDFADSLGAFHRLDDMLSPRLDGSKDPYKYRGPVRSRQGAPGFAADLNCSLGDADIQSQASTGRKTNGGSLFKCGAGETQAAITPFGDMKMCLMIDYPKYSILNSTLKDCWQRLKKIARDTKADGNYRCNSCELESYCKWCPGKAWLNNGNFTSCNSEDRLRAIGLRQELKNCTDGEKRRDK